MKIYTKQGDEGWTRLANGERTFKSDLRVDLYGTADELNSHLGVAIAQLSHGAAAVSKQLTNEQYLLFEMGSELAGYYKNNSGSVIKEADISRLETWIDGFTTELPALRAFILPGGDVAAATLHVCRTVCRRLERKMALALQSQASPEKPAVYPEVLRYTNRLSDYLFVAARYVNFLAGKNDVEWKSREKS